MQRKLQSWQKKDFRKKEQRIILEGWFFAKEIMRECDERFSGEEDCIRIAKTLVEVAERLPLWISDYHVFAGTQDDAFARSYALIKSRRFRWIPSAATAIRWRFSGILIPSEILRRRGSTI